MKHLSILIAIGFLMACSRQNDIPNDVMSIDTMKTIVWDMAHADALAQNLYKKDTGSIQLKKMALYQKVFTIHNIDKKTFYNSYDYYQLHPDKNKILMDSVANYANRIRGDAFKRLD